jgi:cytidylate kinase
MRRWELRERAARDTSVAACIAISRMPGSGGAEIGHRVAEALDFGFFGREVVEKIAGDLHVDHWLLANLDERVRGSIDHLVGDFMARERVSEPEYLRSLTRVVLTLARRGSAVIVGRGAPFILGNADALRVLIIAPREQRVARQAEFQDIPPEEARSLLALREEQRGDFARRYFAVDQNDPLLYDVVVNTGSLDDAGAARVVIEAYRSRFPD